VDDLRALQPLLPRTKRLGGSSVEAGLPASQKYRKNSRKMRQCLVV
jgi:hypothetical protein